MFAVYDINQYLTLKQFTLPEMSDRTTNVSYSISGMRDLLHREGYTYKKPKLVPGNPDREAQEDFVQYYEEFMENKDNNVEVLFLDAVHPEHNTMAAYGWMKKGETRKLKTNSGRRGGGGGQSERRFLSLGDC